MKTEYQVNWGGNEKELVKWERKQKSIIKRSGEILGD